jgi:hypothetical protein
MSTLKNQRELRRLVAQLSECAVDDIAWITSTLGIRERQRLQQLLGELGAGIDGGASQVAGPDDDGDQEEATMNRRLAGFLHGLPPVFEERYRLSLPDVRQQALAALGTPSRTAAQVSARITTRAAESLQKGVMDACLGIVLPASTKNVVPLARGWLARRTPRP